MAWSVMECHCYPLALRLITMLIRRISEGRISSIGYRGFGQQCILSDTCDNETKNNDLNLINHNVFF